MSVKSVYYMIGKLQGENFFMYVMERGFRYLVVNEDSNVEDLKLFQSGIDASAYSERNGEKVIDLENCDLFLIGMDDIMRQLSDK